MPKPNKRKHESEKNVNNKRFKSNVLTENESSKPEKGLNDMPNEMLLKIFSYLGRRDILSATLVKKKWNNLISNSEKMMEKIQTIYIKTDNMKAGIPKFTRPYKKIEAENVKLECDLDLFSRLRKIGSGIEDIYFDHCWFLGNAMTNFLKCFKNVQDLQIKHCDITKVPIQRKVIMRELKCLHLDISTWPLSFIETPKLIKFQCHTMLVEDQKGIIQFLNQQRHLEELDFGCCYNLFHSDTEILEPKFKLKTLRLNDLINYDRNQMMNMLSFMTESLTSLETGIEVGRDVTEYVLRNFVNLKSLVIDCESLSTSPSFYNDIKTSQTLKKVEISGDLDKTIAVLQFLSNHPEIESLDMSLMFNIPSTRYSFWSRLADVTPKVKTLKIDNMDADNVRYIKSKNLKDIRIYSLDYISIPELINFCNNNPNIERIHVYDTDESVNLNLVKTVLTEHLLKLKEFSDDYPLSSFE